MNNMNDSINRRHFLQQAGTAGVGLGMRLSGSLAKADSQNRPPLQSGRLEQMTESPRQ